MWHPKTEFCNLTNKLSKYAQIQIQMCIAADNYDDT